MSLHCRTWGNVSAFGAGPCSSWLIILCYTRNEYWSFTEPLSISFVISYVLVGFVALKSFRVQDVVVVVTEQRGRARANVRRKQLQHCDWQCQATESDQTQDQYKRVPLTSGAHCAIKRERE